MGAEEFIESPRKSVVFKSRMSTFQWEGRRTATDKEIKEEPMLYGASWEFARLKGGDLTQWVMDKIFPDVNARLQEQALLGYHPVIDTKSVMLMPGWVPCIPGWHCDGVIRRNRGNQPDIGTLDEHVLHYTCWIGTSENLAPTLFIESGEKLEIPVDPDNVWGSVDSYVSGLPNAPIKTTESGEITRFTRSTLHTGSPAKERGWRFFFRLSFYHMPAVNEIRNQVQVYPQKSGW